MKQEYINIENLSFPKEDYLFSFKDPNGGLWIKKVAHEENLYRIGASAIVAVKLEKIVKFTILDLYKNENKLVDNEIFLFLKGFLYEINLFAPFDAKIVSINPIVSESTEEHPVVLTQESVYNEHWLLEVEPLDPVNAAQGLLRPEEKKFEKIIKMIIKSDKTLADRCCPNLLDSNVVRRLNKKTL